MITRPEPAQLKSFPTILFTDDKSKKASLPSGIRSQDDGSLELSLVMLSPLLPGYRGSSHVTGENKIETLGKVEKAKVRMSVREK